jgi:hypothetical protein
LRLANDKTSQTPPPAGVNRRALTPQCAVAIGIAAASQRVRIHHPHFLIDTAMGQERRSEDSSRGAAQEAAAHFVLPFVDSPVA